MPITDDLRATAEQAIHDLEDVISFFEHSNIVWRSFAAFVRSGHTVTATSIATHKTIDENSLVALGPRYSRDYLTTFTFRQFVSTFESFFFAFFHRVRQHNPWPLVQRQVDFNTVLRAKDRDEIISTVISKELNEVKYRSVREWFRSLDETIKLGCPSNDDINSLAEVKATRRHFGDTTPGW